MLACCELENIERQRVRVVLRPTRPRLVACNNQEITAPVPTAKRIDTLGAEDPRLRAAAQAFLLRVGS